MFSGFSDNDHGEGTLMNLTLLRHGIADAHGSEDLRALTGEGRLQIEELSRQLHKNGEVYDLILSSPLLRTRQTADIFADTFGLRDKLVCDARLACGCHTSDLQSALQEHRQAHNVLAVGHMPDLGLISAELLGLKEALEFQRGSALKLKGQNLRAGQATLLFFVHPGMF